MDDLRSYDSDLYKHLMQLKHDYKNEMKIEDLGLTFSVTEDIVGTKYNRSLISVNKGKDGSNVGVNFDNREKYINLLCDYKLNQSLSRQYRAFLKGLANIVNIDWLRIFNSDELTKLISGYNIDGGSQSRILLNSLDDFMKNCQYSGGFHKKHRLVGWFWDILKNDFTSDDDKKFLMFVTSCSRPPLLGFKYINPKFCIMCTGSSENNYQSLPTAQTCMNMLKIPNYPSKEMLKEKLLYAIRTNAGFDLS